eukprot:6488444-Amphidinium_carterae.2
MPSYGALSLFLVNLIPVVTSQWQVENRGGMVRTMNCGGVPMMSDHVRALGSCVRNCAVVALECDCHGQSCITRGAATTLAPITTSNHVAMPDAALKTHLLYDSAVHAEMRLKYLAVG